MNTDTTAAARLQGDPTPIVVSPDDEHNRALVEATHPPEWVNPEPAGRYNLVVIGAGTAGLVSAAGAAGLGARVALIERHLMGGDCLNYGCVPSKALLRVARAAHAVREAPEFGIRVNGPGSTDFGAAMERLRRLRAGIAVHDSAARFAGLGIDVFLGQAAFSGPRAVEVDGRRLEFSRAVIATGARAAAPAIPGLADAGFLTNETVFSLTALPGRLAVLGAGPIGCELAQAFARLGSQVTLITRGTRVLPRDDEAASAVLARQLAREGVTVVLGATIVSVCGGPGGRTLRLSGECREDIVEADEILVAVGRTPNVDGLNLVAAGVAHGPRGVEVDDRLRTSNPRIYAAGDICSKYQFTHAADAMARIVIQNALFFGRRRASALVIPWATYTDPEIAHVGLGEAGARARQTKVVTLHVGFDDVDRAVLDGETDGFARAYVDARSGRILGATIVARHAGDLIGEMSLAMTTGLKIGDLSRTVHPYPTVGEALRKLGDAWMRRRLTPRVRGLFERYLAWMR